MPPTILLDEFQVGVRIPPDLPPKAVAAIRRRVRSAAFRRALTRAVRAALGPPFPAGVWVAVFR